MHNTRCFICICFATLISANTHAQSPVRLCEDPWPPYILGEMGGTATGGTVVERLEQIFSALGEKLIIELRPWLRCLEMAKRGQFDGIPLLKKTPEREEFLDYSDVLMETRISLWHLPSRFPKGLEWNSIEDLTSYKYALLRGYSAGPEFDAADKEGRLNVGRVNTLDLTIKLLVNKRIDLIPLNKEVAEEYNATKYEGEKLVAVKKPLHSNRLYLGFSKSSDAKHLLPAINLQFAK